VRIPICGIGGISSGEDAVKFLLCGATAVQVGTANYLNPLAGPEVAEGIVAYAARHGFARVADLVGALEPPDPAGRSGSPAPSSAPKRVV
jgi:dihydroorotate dehydrogenase (NAD+) catalytic subunit